MNHRTSAALCILLVALLVFPCTPVYAGSCGPKTCWKVSLGSQSLQMDRIRDARDFGCYHTEDGRYIKSGLLLRSAALEEASESDLEDFSDQYQVGTVIDLRSEAEQAQYPDRTIAGAVHVSCPIDPIAFPDDSDILQARLQHGSHYADQIAENYYTWLCTDPSAQASYRAIFHQLLRSGGKAVLLHGQNGKDRTGFGAALILSALGVDRETIEADYLISNESYADEIHKTNEAVQNRYPLLGSEAGSQQGKTKGVDAAWLRAAFSVIDSRYGGVSAYLKNQMGLSQTELAKLRSVYLA